MDNVFITKLLVKSISIVKMLKIFTPGCDLCLKLKNFQEIKCSQLKAKINRQEKCSAVI